MPESAEAAALAFAAAGAGLSAALGFGPAIGWAIASFIGSFLFAPKQPTIRGPRLEDTTVQSSAAGAPWIRFWGTMRLAGGVKDGKKLDEVPIKKKVGGKGGGGATQITYIYLWTGAVGICHNQIDGCRRIWADTKLIYPVDGAGEMIDTPDYQILQTQFGEVTIYKGKETQLPDADLEAIHGVGNTPAYRGRAYAKFKDFNTTALGRNSVPNFSFEVFTDGSSSLAAYSTALFPDADRSNKNVAIVHVDENGEYLAVERQQLVSCWPANFKLYRGNTVSGTSAIFPEDKDESFSQCGEGFFTTTVGVGHLDEPAYIWQRSADKLVVFLFNSGSLVTLDWPSSGSLFSGTQFGNSITAKLGDEFFVSCFEDSGNDNYLWKFEGENLVQVVKNGVASGTLDLFITDQWYYKLHRGGGTEKVQRIDRSDISTVVEEFDLQVTPNKFWKFYVANDDLIYLHKDLGGGTFEIWALINFSELVLVEQSTGGFAPSAASFSFQFRNGIFYFHSTTQQTVYMYALTSVANKVPLSLIQGDIFKMNGYQASDFDVSQLTDLVWGYALPREMSGREGMNPLLGAYHYDCVESDGQIKCIKRGGAQVSSIPKGDLAAHELGSKSPELVMTRRADEGELPAVVEVNYISYARDYQQGHAEDERLITENREKLQVDIPVALSDNEARQIAEIFNMEQWLQRNHREIRLSRQHARLEPTDVIEVVTDNQPV